MTFAEDKTSELWRSFMPRLKEIRQRESNQLFSLQVYNSGFDFSPHSEFVKWALAPVSSVALLPDGMESLTISRGLYAVFNYRGRAGDPRIFAYIFSEWIPLSAYQLDERPHFEIMGDGYDPSSPDSEEEIWIPVRRKGLWS